jgi:steroid 5-alpha reductase family enzyme
VTGLRMGGGLLTSGAIVGGANLLGLGITLASGTHLVTDLLGSGAFAVSAVASQILGGGGGQRALISTVIITAWSVRLAGFLFYRILNTKTDDRLSEQFKTPTQSTIFWTFSGLWGWICLLPHSILCFSPKAVAMGPFGWLAAAAAVGGLLVETVADQQKWAFKQTPEAKVTFCKRGLWKWSRHPNYCGELVVWSGLFLLTLPTVRQRRPAKEP